MKRIVSLVLCIVLSFSLVLQTYAVYNAKEDLQEAATFYSEESGFDSIKKSSNGEYALTNAQGDYQPVGRLDVELDNEYAVDSVLEMDNLSREIRDYIAELAENVANVPENQGLVASIFSPDLLPERQSRAITYKEYEGVQFKTEQVSTYDFTSEYKSVVNGSTAYKVAKAIKEVALYLAGEKIPGVSLGQTVLSFFEALSGPVYTGSSADYLQMRVTYDNTKQWTYGTYDGTTWLLGYASQKVKVTKVDENQFYVPQGSNTGVHKETSQRVNKTVASPYFDEPWKIAITALYHPVDSWVEYSFKDTKWRFV